MRKFYLFFAAMFAYSVVATAGIKNLFKQDFETCGTPQNAGWSSPNLAGGMSIASSENGSWFEFSLGGNNNRNAVMDFNYGQEEGATIYGDQSMKKYTVKFQWGIQANTSSPGNPKNAQFSTEVALITPSIITSEMVPEGWKITASINNGQYAGNDSLRLFSITQLKGAYSEADGVSTNPYWEDGNDNSNFILDYYFNGDQENKVTLEEGMWYDIAVTVDTEARTASYVMTTLLGDAVAEGTYTIPEYCSVWAKGLNVLLGRYNAIAAIDEVKVQVETEGDYANAPSISLIEIDQEKRTYDIYFETGEILNVKTTEGTTDTATESPYRYITSTSGTLDAWTTSGTAESEHAIQDVDASVIALPEAKIDITKVNNGYVKTYKMTVDNSSVPTQPNILLTYKYNGVGDENLEVPSGTSIDVTEKGTLEVTTRAYGFAPTTITIENDTEFAIDKTVDFQHMDEAKLTELGFTEIDPLQDSKMSGELNWTARERLWYGIADGGVDDAGNPTYEKHVVWGPATTEGASAIRRFTLASDKLTQETAYSMFAPVYTWYTGQADPAVTDGTDVAGMKVNYGIGLINDGIKGGTDKINYAEAPMGVDGLTENDYYIVYVINNYGGSSLHPLFEQGTAVADALTQYMALNLGDGLNPLNLTPTDTDVRVLRGTETFTLYRIDTAIASIEVFKSTGADGIKALPYNQIVSDHNAPIYNLNGVQVNAKTLKKGVYVKQGKKFVVK